MTPTHSLECCCSSSTPLILPIKPREKCGEKRRRSQGVGGRSLRGLSSNQAPNTCLSNRGHFYGHIRHGRWANQLFQHRLTALFCKGILRRRPGIHSEFLLNFSGCVWCEGSCLHVFK